MENQNAIQDPVRNYFDQTVPIYRSWSKNHLHMGLWRNNTRNHEESLDNMTKFVSKLLDIEEGDRILDAGCGIGGSTRYIASEFGVKTIGINISRVQLHKAVKLSKDVKNSCLIRYYCQDYTKTFFPSAYFSKIFAIESVCHTRDKNAFIEEAFRLLRRGGRIVVVDGFQKQNPITSKERSMYQRFLKGWAVPNLETFASFSGKLKQAGFNRVHQYDLTKNVLRSLFLIHRSAKRLYPIAYLLRKLKIVNKIWYGHLQGAYELQKLVNLQICNYGAIVAEK
ncbi:MAG: SAM-dependent methyltransferase [Candidatus Hodarchaeota archaeon]